MPFLNLGDISIYYLIAGKGTPVTLLHGAAMTAETNWSNQIPVFSRKYKVMAMDLRGHGRTTNPLVSLDYHTMAEDVIKLLEKHHFKKTHLIGFSMGGMIATHIVLNNPELVRTLILCSSGYHVSQKARDLFARSANIQMKNRYNSKWIDFYKKVHKKGGTNYWKQLLDQVIKSSQHKIHLKEALRISVPTLIIVGDRDPYGFTSQALKLYNAIRNSELAVFPNTGHLIPNNKPKLFNETVLDFFNRKGREDK